MEVKSSDGQSATSNNMGIQTSVYFNAIANRLRSFLPASTSSPASNIAIIKCSPKRRRRGLPIPLPAILKQSSVTSNEVCSLFNVLEDIFENVLHNLHIIEKNLEFWQSREEVSNTQRAYFMICQRGPLVFINGTFQLMRDCLFADGSVMQNLNCAASYHISKRTSVLTNLKCSLATFLAKFYTEFERSGGDLTNDLEKSLPSLLVVIFDLFFTLEASFQQFHANLLRGSAGEAMHLHPLRFARLPEVNEDGSHSTDYGTKYALIYNNLHMLGSYLSVIVSEYQKPRKITLYWMPYSCGLLGISICSLLLFQHNNLIGSSGTTNWVNEVKVSITNVREDRVKQPTFSKRQCTVEHEEVMLAADSLHSGYVKELTEPINGLVVGKLGITRSLLDEFQMLMDIHKSIFELNEVFRANTLNLANLVALPSFIALGLFILVWTVLNRGVKSDRAARRLLEKIKSSILHFRHCEAHGSASALQWEYGMLLYYLDSLHCIVKNHAKLTDIQDYLVKEIVDMAKPAGITKKYLVASEMKNFFSRGDDGGY